MLRNFNLRQAEISKIIEGYRNENIKIKSSKINERTTIKSLQTKTK
jgi:hypothetical protein